jgi:hypothetical protein
MNFSFCIYAQKEKYVTLDLAKAIKNSPKEIMLSEIASDIQYIPLETNDNCLIDNSYNIRYMEDDILVGSVGSDGGKFYHFSKDGKYLNKIGSKGNGPEEYPNGLFYFADPTKKYIYVYEWNFMNCYTYNGKFVRRLKSPDLNMGTAELMSQGNIIYSNDMYFSKPNDPLQLFIIDSVGKPISGMKGYVEKNKRYGINLSSRDFIYEFDGETYFKPALENLVYKIIPPKKKEIAWKFEVGSKDIQVERDETSAKNRVKSISVFQIRETPDYLFILYGLEKQTYNGLYDKEKKTFDNVTIKDDLSGGIDVVPAGKSDPKYIQMAYFPKVIKDFKCYTKASLPHRKKELDNLLANLNEEDNPILILITLK